MKIYLTRFLLSFISSTFIFSCGNDPVRNELPPNLPGPINLNTQTPAESENVQLRPEKELNGRYIGTIRLSGGQLSTNAQGQLVEILIGATALANVKQFEMVLHADPIDSFDLSGSNFVPAQPFISPPNSIETTTDGMWRTGGASISGEVNGDASLGTLKLTTGSAFEKINQAIIHLEFFSIGPSSSDRDDYYEKDLSVGMTIGLK